MSRRIPFFALGLVMAVGLSLGCGKKHEDFPAPLDVSVPPNVSNMEVFNPQNLDYDVKWGIGDASTVQYYRVYASLNGVDFILAEDSVPTTSPPTCQTDCCFDPLTPCIRSRIEAFAPVAVFGVTVVSNENVEGAMVVESTP